MHFWNVIIFIMLHLNTVDPKTYDLLQKLMQLEFLESYYLVGGTALSLQIGHRKSIDLDLFGKVQLDFSDILDACKSIGKIEQERTNGIITQFTLDDVKIDIVKFKDNLIKPLKKIDGVRLASIEDIAAMKLSAIEQRGAKKDFYDLYSLLDIFSLDELLDFHKQKSEFHNAIHVYKSMLDYRDAEEDPEPESLILVNWEQVKDRITKEVQAKLIK
jgi:predicted nucleotidyltransferase component of viral defense system